MVFVPLYVGEGSRIVFTGYSMGISLRESDDTDQLP